MKYSDETERRLLSACWLREREMRDLLVKNIVCCQGRWTREPIENWPPE